VFQKISRKWESKNLTLAKERTFGGQRKRYGTRQEGRGGPPEEKGMTWGKKEDQRRCVARSSKKEEELTKSTGRY